MISLSEWLREQMNKQGWSISETARRANVSHTTISGILNSGANPGHKSCNGIARAFNVPQEDVERMAGILPPLRGEQNSVASKIYRLAKKLTPEKRQILFEIAMGFYSADQAADLLDLETILASENE